MKRIDLTASMPSPHFIGSWFIEPLFLCEDLIDFFETYSANHTAGKTAGGLNLEAKKSTDLSIRPRDLEQADHKVVRDYIEALFTCHRDYLEQWPFIKSILPRVEIGSFNIQRYDAGGHFQKIHSERSKIGTSHRILAWMTYLNDVDDGGATHFTHQGISVQPQRGKTLIWPAEWTHAHKGELVSSASKYIITGWMHFPPDRA